MKTLITKKTAILLVTAVLLMIIFSGCANKETVDACLKWQKFGFWYGLLHGIISPINFIFMFFRDDITIYATNNNGLWYAFGFLLGSGGWGFMGSKGARRARKKKDCQ